MSARMQINQVMHGAYRTSAILCSDEILQSKVIFFIQRPNQYYDSDFESMVAQIDEIKRWIYKNQTDKVEMYKQFSHEWWFGFFSEEDAMLFKLRFVE